MAQLLEGRHDRNTMVTLDLKSPLLYGSTGADTRLQFLQQRLFILPRHLKTFYDRNGFTASALAVKPDNNLLLTRPQTSRQVLFSPLFSS